MGTKRYAVLGAGRQGEAAAYDLAIWGDAAEVVIADKDGVVAEKAAERLNALIGQTIIRSVTLDVTDTKAVVRALWGMDGFVSAMHYALNPDLSEIAIRVCAHMVDLGGNTGVVFRQHMLDARVQKAELRIIPDCGMAPGFNINLVAAALMKMAFVEDAEPKSAVIYCGGIPQKPKMPLGYHFPFSVKGLVNECSGSADVIQDGEVTQRSCLESIENVLVPGIGMLEATHTSGGLSTSPWMLNKLFPSLQTLEYQTLRYPGHWKILQRLARKGNLESGLTRLEAKTAKDPEDLGVIQVVCSGVKKDRREVRLILDVVDRYDPKTHFTAMQRLTGFHAAIMLAGAAMKTLPTCLRGVLDVGSIHPMWVIKEFAKRGVTVEETRAIQG